MMKFTIDEIKAEYRKVKNELNKKEILTGQITFHRFY